MGILKAAGWFVGGVLTGSAGFKILGSDDAKKAYTHATAAALRCKDCTMDTATVLKVNADDILAGAKKINEERALKKDAAVVEDAAV